MCDFQVYISGAHEDERRASRLARALRREGVPRSLRRPVCGMGPYPARIGPVLTHRRERPTATRLDDEARDALAQSARLIVLASPEAARSGWVAAEILAFRRAGRGGRILYLVPDQPDGEIAEGSLVSALPPAARFALGADGALTARPESPALAQIIDARGAGRRGGRRRLARRVAARLIDAAPRTLTRRRRARRLRRSVAACAVAAVAVAGAAAIQTAERGAGRAAKLADARASAQAAAATAQAALDRGDAEAAYAALDEAFADQEADVFGTAVRDAPPSALSALARAQLEARLIAETPAPGPAHNALRVLPGGALASVEADGRTHLIDLGAGSHKTVFAPDAPAHTRISADGETLWAAHFEPERIDETGARYTPLIFEEADLATGRVRLSTAVRSVHPFGASAEFSPDGALFAADLGPGRGADTLIGVFRRAAQGLAGVLALPSDRAEIHFAGARTLLAVTDPPSRYAGAPGLYLWRIGAPAPQILRAPGLAPICPGRAARARSGKASEGVVAPQVLVSPDRREAGLLLSDEAGGCLLRWSLPDGVAAPALTFERPAVDGAILGAGGPYLAAAPGAPYRLRLSAARTEAAPLAGCRPGKSGAPRRLSPAGAPLVIRCAGGLVHFGAEGAVRWRPPAQDAVAAAYGPARRHLVTAHPGSGDESGEGARLRVWDAAPRARWLDRSFHGGRLVALGHGVTLAIDDAGRARVVSEMGVRAAAAIMPPDAQDIAIDPLEGGFGVTAKVEDRLNFRLHDAADGAARLRLEDLVVVSAAPDGGRVLTVDADGGAAWRDAASGEVLIETRRVGSIFIDGAAHDEGYVLFAQEDAPGGPVLALYAKREGPPLRRIGFWPGRSGAVRVSPDGRRALVRIEGGGGAPDGYELVDLEPGAGAPRARLINDAPISRRGEPATFGFSPDGAVIWFVPPRGAERSVRILNARDGALVRLAPLGGSAAPVFSKAGLLALGGNRLRIFARSGLGAPVCPGLGDGLAAPVGSIAFSPDGALIAVASGRDADATLTVFDLAACAPRLRRSITVTAAPVFAGPDRLRVAVRGALIELSLSAPPAAALGEIRARLAGIRSPD